MAEIAIPGVSDKYGTTKLIEDLMKLERVPLERAKTEKETYEKEKVVWSEVSQRLSKLQDSSRTLYSFDNPFNERIADSNNEAVTATATREASLGDIKIQVIQTAGTDRFLSKNLDKNYQVPKGQYTFLVGDKSVEFNWKGGSIKEFTEAVNRRGNGLVKASIIGVSSTEQAFLIESLKTGKENSLSFENDALNFALEVGIIRKIPNQSGSLQDITVKETEVKTLPFPSTVMQNENKELSFTVTVETRPDESLESQIPPSGPVLPDPGGISFQGISVYNEQGDIPLDPWTAPPVPPKVDNMNVLYLKKADGTKVPLDAIRDGMTDFQYTVKLKDIGDVTGLLIENTNTHRTLSLKNISITGEGENNGYQALNPVDTAKDSIIKYEGITMTRSTNEIDDVVPGVTLNLHDKTDGNATIKIQPDTELAKDAIITFVANYNRVMADLNILTQTNPAIIEELEYFTDDEIEKANERLGMLQGDFTLNNIKTTLQTTMANPYKADEETHYQLLDQIGISTSASGPGSTLNKSKLRGYLEINEKKLDEALENNITEVQKLFGFDSDGDLAIDNGVAYVVYSKIRPYVQTAGILTMKTDSLNSKIDRTDSTIKRLDQQLEKKEQELRTKYGNMEGQLRSLESQSNSLDQRFNSGSNN